MPPKAVRGRGGGGRGGSSGPASSLPENQSSMAGSPTLKIEPGTTGIPENGQSAMDLDPINSPATQPTETPASTPNRPASSSQTRAADGSSGSGTRGGTRGRGKESKFKPKNVRRTADELKALADQESKRLAALAATAARARARGNAFRGRGRGDAMGRGRGTVRGVASGPFAVAPEMSKRPGMFAPGSGIKREGGGGGGGFTVTSGSKSQNGSIPGVRFGTGSGSNPYVIADPQYPDEDEDVPRIDIEQINLISDDEDEQVASDTKGKGKAIAGSAKGGLKPVRLYRQEHKERKSQVTSGPSEDPSTENKSDSDTVLADEGATLPAPPTEEKRFKGVYQDDDDEVRIKDEPVEPAEMINRLHSPEPNLEASSSSAPDFKQTIDELGTDVVVKKNEPESPNQLRKKAPSKKKGNKFVIQTEEDRAEWERHLEDLAILTEELGGMLGPSTEKGKEKDAEGDIDMDAEKPVDRKEGRLYLFQFPPVMPKLYNPAKDPKPIVTGEKKAEGDVELTGSADKNAVDLTKDVKVEGEEIIIKKEDEEPTNKKGRERLADEEGFVGKLIVRESGRVELDWGGSRMLVGRGIETSFLTMGVLVDSKGCLDKDGKSTGEGTATGMGQIMGKLVVTPDWESMTEDLERQQKFERRQKREKHK